MILMLDNYDSFTYNLVQYLREMSADIHVARNDALSVADVEKLAPQAIVISPGPGRPEDAGICCEVIRRCSGRIPLLGVCLGHQAIGLAYGGTVGRAPQPRHGKTSPVRHDGRGVFPGLPQPALVTRYHSLAVHREGFPAGLEVTATAEDDGQIMGLRDPAAAVEGVQFHPESIRTDDGMRIFENFVRIHVHPGFGGGARRAA